MANFTKIFGLAGATLIFAGLSYGQNTVTCSGPATTTMGVTTVAPNPVAAPVLVRAEGTTELVGEINFSCTNSGAATTANILDILSLPVTSKVLNTSTGATEASLVNSATLAVVAQGIASGNQLTFSSVPIAASATTNFTIVNVRVNASGLTVGTGAPPPVTESLFISGPLTTATATTAATVAYALPGLSTVTLYKSAPAANTQNPNTGSSKGVNNFVICAPINKSNQGGGVGLLSTISFGENFATAFKGLVGTPANPFANPATTATNTNPTLGSEFANNTETGFTPPGGFISATTGVNNIASEPTTIQIVFSNVPSNFNIYLPVSVPADQQTFAAGVATGPGLGTLTLVSSSGATVSAAASSSTLTGLTAQIAASNGTATAYYQFTPGAGSSAAQETFSVGVYGVSSANAVTASSTAITAAISFSPTGTTTIPSFVVGSSTVSQTLSTFNGCTTSLLFPFVTNQSGFDTGIAIANTSTDPFGTKGATAQSGTCTLNFYGNGAPSPSNITTATVPSGTVYTGILSGLAAGFQGYMIAQCQFQYAHGFAFLTDGVGSAGGLSEGYLAGVIPDVNQISRGANPIGNITQANVGETLGN